MFQNPECSVSLEEGIKNQDIKIAKTFSKTDGSDLYSLIKIFIP
jgi:phosphoribosylpyrophosphate synthetase